MIDCLFFAWETRGRFFCLPSGFFQARRKTEEPSPCLPQLAGLSVSLSVFARGLEVEHIRNDLFGDLRVFGFCGKEWLVGDLFLL